MKMIIMSLLLLWPAFSLAGEKADAVVVIKSQSKLILTRHGRTISTYHVALGGNPKGHKQQRGDRRTPEGTYVLDYKKVDSAYYRSIHISYPNEADKKRASALGVHPGGSIMIHGQKNGFGHLAPITQRTNWTDGCIAVTNREMDEIWQAIDIGTPIAIKP